MALDGIFLKCLKNEIQQQVLSMRVEKIHQPSREEIVLHLRGRNGARKLLISSRANSPRLNFVQTPPENPKTPPMFCMLLRKYLQSAMISGVRQHETDRIIFIDFDASNEIGDRIKLFLCVEIMAQHSNIILIDENKNIVDAIKRVDMTKSSVRQVLPGFEYTLPPAQNKFDLEKTDVEQITEKIFANAKKTLSSSIMSVIQGISPIAAREIACRVCSDDIPLSQADAQVKQNTKKILLSLQNDIREMKLCPYVFYDGENKPKDFSFLPITQYGSIGKCEKKESFSSLLDEFYFQRDNFERTKQKSNDLYKFLQNTISRISKKINLQKSELEKCADRQQLKTYAELINAYQYCLEKGKTVYRVENYYDDNKEIEIPAEASMTPSENSRKYYKEYKKAKTAEIMLTRLIEENEQELLYIESVLDELSRSETQEEINDIRNELADNGYGKKNQKEKIKKKKNNFDFIKYKTSDNFAVLVGKNNIQNDYLSLKKAKSEDMWLHTKEIPGSHVIIVADGREISDRAIEEASVIAAYHSKARQSYQVPVNYTFAKELKKPVGARPGKVIYHKYYTITANPNVSTIKKLKK